ncbi:8808_t:CDS:2 [Funneliformis geosporum]|uniref:8808_t:CDS:1 n=1 Tax=Funneliformis geosporum TaxID=1117311 RepID=A0A9W4WSU8_9GLOM|nr:8808_t:CDS:2 [Funneliformis geosporum]
MSTKHITRKRGRINVVACNKCKRDKKKCDGSYLTQKPCRYCRDRNEFCEYTEPTRLRVTRIQGDNDEGLVSSDVGEVIINECEIISNQRQNDPLQHKMVDNESCKSDLFFQLFTDPDTTTEQMNILKRLYNEIMRNPEDPKLPGNQRDELCTKLKILSSSNKNVKIQIWNDLCSLVNELDKIITGGDSTILDSSFLDYNSWNSETLGFSSPVIPNTDIFSSDSTIPKTTESHGSNSIFSTELNLNSSTVLNDPQPAHGTVQSARKNKKTEIQNVKKTNNSKQRKNQRGNKRTQPYPAGGQIVIRPTKQAHTMIWHQNDPIDDVPIMAFHIQSSTHAAPSQPAPPPRRQAPHHPQRAQFQPPQTFAHYVPSIPIDLWDHSTTMTMLSPEPNSGFSEPNNDDILPITNSILLSPTPSLQDDLGDIVSSPSNSSIDHMRAISDDETERFGFAFTQSTRSPQSFTMEDFNFIEMYSNTSSVGMVDPFWKS